MKKALIALPLLAIAAWNVNADNSLSSEPIPPPVVSIINVGEQPDKRPVPTRLETDQQIEPVFSAASLPESTNTEVRITRLETPTELLPKQKLIDIPFYTQAPKGDWSYPWQESCEEASVALVVNHYLQKNWNVEQFSQAILQQVEWQKAQWGQYYHSNVEQTRQMMLANFGIDGVIYQDPDFETIKEIINRDHLILAPFAGKFLFNPYYSNGGSPYHMMVITGYDENTMEVLIHDVGTRRGANYRYKWEVVKNALHDYDEVDVLRGQQAFIEVLR